MHQITQHYINGQWVDPVAQARRHSLISPVTELEIGTVLLGSAADVDRAVAAARAAFASWSQTSAQQRVEALERIAAEYERRMGDMAQAIHEEIGAPMWLASSMQAPVGLQMLRSAIAALRAMHFSEQLGNTEVVSEAMGVAALITPWNWPMTIVCTKVASALAAGCTVVLKPSELAPLDARLFAEIVDAAQLPAGVFNMVFGDGPEVGAALSRHPDVDVISLTGSTRAGAQVATDAAGSIKRVLLELGGKSPNLILDDAELGKAVSDGVVSCMINSGQTCIAPTRMLVPRALHAQACAIAAATVDALKVGDPTQPESKIGPLANRAQFDKVRQAIALGVASGARVVAGGEGMPDGVSQGFFVKPTVFTDLAPDHELVREEIFGPVLVIQTYEDEADGIRMANDSHYGLAAYVRSADGERAQRVARQLRAGMVRVNGASPDAAAPFGGYKRSGNGREFGRWGIAEYLETKSISR